MYRALQDSRKTLALSVALSLLQSALLVPIATATKRIFDTLIPQGRTQALTLTGLLIVALYLASAGVGLLTRYVVQRAVKRGIARYRRELIDQLVALPQAYFDRRETGLVHASVVQDTERIDSMSSALASVLIPAAIVGTALAATLLYLNAFLFLVVLAIVPLTVAAAKLLGRVVRAYGLRWQSALDQFSARTLLTIRSLPLIRIHGAEAITLDAREREIHELSRAGLDLTWRTTAYSIASSTIATSTGVAVLIVGGGAVARHDMSMGSLLSFYAVLALLLRQVGSLTSSIPIVILGRTSMRRLDDLFSGAPQQPYRRGRAISFEGAIAADDVSFAYAGRESVLRGVSLSVARGEHIAVVGPNGAGKSTLLRLMLGLYRPDAGTMRADGVPFDEIDVSLLRTQMGVVLQDPILLPGTVAENIAFGRPAATRDEIQRAARWASVDRFVDDLPHGYDTQAGEDAARLSGGQRQRVAIARALIGDPALVLLDEPTTHLDDSAIAELLTSLRSLPRSPAVLVITHDLKVASSADRVYELRDGAVVGELADATVTR